MFSRSRPPRSSRCSWCRSRSTRCALTMASYEYWLNVPSSIRPTSVTRFTLKPFGRGDALVLGLLAFLVEGRLDLVAAAGRRRSRRRVRLARTVVVVTTASCQHQCQYGTQCNCSFQRSSPHPSSSPRAPVGARLPRSVSHTIVGPRRCRGTSDHGCVNAVATNAATSALCSARARLAGIVRPPVASAIAARMRGVTAAPRSPALSLAFVAAVMAASITVGFDRVLLRDRHGEENAASRPERAQRARHVGDLDRVSRPAGVAAAHSTGTRTSGTRRYATRGPGRSRLSRTSSVRGEIEERLRTGADRDDRMRRDRAEIRADVARAFDAAVHAADAAGREHVDPYRRGERERCGNSRDADRRALRDRDGELALGNFHAARSGCARVR